jgi:hypothetical protein
VQWVYWRGAADTRGIGSTNQRSRAQNRRLELAISDPDNTPYLRPYTRDPRPYTLYPIPYTLYPTPYTLYPISYTLYPIPYTLYPIPYTLNPISQLLNGQPMRQDAPMGQSTLLRTMNHRLSLYLLPKPGIVRLSPDPSWPPTGNALMTLHGHGPRKRPSPVMSPLGQPTSISPPPPRQMTKPTPPLTKPFLCVWSLGIAKGCKTTNTISPRS